jgi:hypothetical protein
MKKRYKLTEGDLFMMRRDGTNGRQTKQPTFARQLHVSQSKWRKVLTVVETHRIIEEVHSKNHNGERRLNTELSAKYVVHNQHHAVHKQCGEGCSVCMQWSSEPTKPVSDNL